MTARRIAVLGLGAMGAGIAASLLRAGFAPTVHNRTPGRAGALAGAGATVADSAAAAVREAEVVVLSLADESAVTDTLFPASGGALPTSGSVVVDTSTVSPDFARRVSARLAEHGVVRVEACVVGNPPMAAAGRLRVLTAGDPTAADSVAEVLAAFAQEVRHVGPTGSASTLKLALNLLLGVQTAGLAEALALAEGADIDREVLLDTVDGSGWHSPVLSFRGAYMRRRSYGDAGFRAALMHKDLSLALSEAAEAGIDLPVGSGVRERYARAMAAGRGDEDAAVLADLDRAGPTGSS